MRRTELNDLMDKVFKDASALLKSKNTTYSKGESDGLSNFKCVAGSLETSPLKVWATYYLKHHLSVMAYIRRGDESEPIEERALDIINYMVMLVALVREERRSEL